MIVVPSLHIIYASTSGHTEYVIDILMAGLNEQAAGKSSSFAGLIGRQGSALQISKQRAELASPEDLLKGDILLLATGTWNTGGVEGQLNPYMHVLLKEKAAAVDLKGKKVAVIALGDSRYRYTAGSAAHAEEFVKSHNGQMLCETLKIVNEPYGQEKKVEEWGKVLLSKLSTR